MPSLLTTNAIVLSRQPWSETSQIVTLIAPELGRTGAVSRGSKRPTSAIGPALEPITESEIVLSRSTGGGLAHVRSADVIEYFGNLKRSLVRVTIASALCELASRVLPEEEENVAAYADVRQALGGIDDAEDRDAINWLWWGALRLVADVGYGIQATECVHCGNTDEHHRWFSPSEGGPLCGNCTGTNLREWLPGTESAVRKLLGADDAVAAGRLPKRVNHDLRALIEDYLRYHVPNFDHLRALDVLVGA